VRSQSASIKLKDLFRGQPLRDVPVPTAYVLCDDEFGAAVLAEYHDRVRLEFHENPFLKIFKVSGGHVHGSNPFACCLLDSIVRPYLRVATPPDLQAILDSRNRCAEPLRLRGFYKDVALALRTAGEPNGYLALKLNEQIGLKTPLPVAIFLSGLEIVNDSESPCALAFRLTRDAHYFTAPILSEKSGHFQNRGIDLATGLPGELGGEQRYYYGSDQGLTRIYIGRGWSIDTIWDELGNSQVDGRVVFVENRVPPAQVARYLSSLDQAARNVGYEPG
jgi:hypothetical protein